MFKIGFKELNLFIMVTLEFIWNEIKSVPASRLGDLWDYVQILTIRGRRSKQEIENIMVFSGAFSEMTESDFQEFMEITKDARNNFGPRVIE